MSGVERFCESYSFAGERRKIVTHNRTGHRKLPIRRAMFSRFNSFIAIAGIAILTNGCDILVPDPTFQQFYMNNKLVTIKSDLLFGPRTFLKDEKGVQQPLIVAKIPRVKQFGFAMHPRTLRPMPFIEAVRLRASVDAPGHDSAPIPILVDVDVSNLPEEKFVNLPRSLYEAGIVYSLDAPNSYQKRDRKSGYWMVSAKDNRNIVHNGDLYFDEINNTYIICDVLDSGINNVSKNLHCKAQVIFPPLHSTVDLIFSRSMFSNVNEIRSHAIIALNDMLLRAKKDRL